MPGFLTKQERIKVDGVDDVVLRSLLDHHQFHDPDGAAAALGISSALWPIFGLNWPSAQYLAARLALRLVSPDERVLELGCGLALSSLVGHRRGINITASDCHPMAEQFLLENLRLNGLAPMWYRHGDWSTTHDVATALRPCVSGLFDLIIASDVLYERDPAGSLAHYIERHVARAAQVWIVDPDRGNRAAFNRYMADFGFDRDEQKLVRKADHARPAYRGRMLTYTRAA